MDKLKEILERVAMGEIAPDEARALIRGKHAPNPSSAKPDKRKRGRPRGTISPRRQELYGAILALWVQFHDRMPKTKLRQMLADGLGVEDSYIGKAIARINRLEKSGAFIGRSKDGQVIALTAEEVRRSKLRQTLGMSPFRQGELLNVFDSQKKLIGKE